jgi:hypothetical protein
MAVAFRTNGAGSATFTASASPVVTKPTGVTDGDLVLLPFAGDTTFTMTTPAGWSLLASVNNGTDNTTAVIYKFASGEPASWTFTNLFTSVQTGEAGVVTYSGVDTTTPINTSASGTTTSTNPHSAPSITPTVDNCMILTFSGCDNPSSSFTATPGTSPVTATERLDANTGSNTGWVYCEEFLQGTAAAIALQYTTLTAVTTCAISAALAPAVAAPSGLLPPRRFSVPHHRAGRTVFSA